MEETIRRSGKSDSESSGSWWRRRSPRSGSCVLAAFVFSAVLCLAGTLLVVIFAGRLLSGLTERWGDDASTPWLADSATLTVAVSPAMRETFDGLIAEFNGLEKDTPDGNTMRVQTVTLTPQEMVDQSVGTPPFQALAPDSSLWLDQLERRWAALQDVHQATDEEIVIPLGNRRVNRVVRYATSPIVIAAWEDVARDLGWPAEPVGWREIQAKATEDPSFRWSHPSTSHASGLLATLAEFYAGANLTRGLTEEIATSEETLAYVQAVESTVRFYGEGEDVILERLAAEGKGFLDAFVVQEQLVLRWNRMRPDEHLVALYPTEGTLWADHPLALLALGGGDEPAVTGNQELVFSALAEFLASVEVQDHLLAAGYRPTNLDIALDREGSPFSQTDAVDWRQPKTTLQMPSASVVDVVQHVWWYIKRPTNVYLVVDTSGSMGGDKLRLTKTALHAFVGQIRGDRDQVGLIEFGGEIKSLKPLQPLDDAHRLSLEHHIDRLEASGQTALLDAVWHGYDSLQRRGDTEAINALVVMTDGQENASRVRVEQLLSRLKQDTAVDVVVFTIAFGRGADENLLRRIAEAGRGQFRRADETDIEQLYRVISTYF